MTAQAIRQALVSGTPAGIATACDACTTTSSANAPQRIPWTARSPPASMIGEASSSRKRASHSAGAPSRQRAQRPQLRTRLTTTRSPEAGAATPGPASTTTPQASCPNTAGSAPPQSPLA